MHTGRTEDLEEGDVCPACEDGSLDVVQGRDCSCHLSPPCSSCVEDGLLCDACGWRSGDGWPDPPPRICVLCDQPAFPDSVFVVGQASGPSGVILADGEIAHPACLETARNATE